MEQEQKTTVSFKQPCKNGFCRVIVEISGENNDQIKSVVEANHGKVFREIKLIPSLVVEIPSSALPELSRLGQVKKISNDLRVRECDQEV